MTESSTPNPDTSAPAEPVPDTTPDPAATAPVSDTTDTTGVEAGEAQPIDLDAIESDLAGVEQALVRLADGNYWTDEVTGDTIPDDVLDAEPTARRVPQH